MRTLAPRPFCLLSLTFAVGTAACSSARPGDAPEELGTSVAAVTASEAIARAELWVAAKLLYCQSPNGADDSIDPACSPICMRQSNPDWDPYRSDCSGLVSWAWELPAPGRTTAELAPNQNDITSVIDASTLATGDAVNTDDSASDEHHVMLFKAWTKPGEEATFIEEPGCSATPDYAHEFTSTVSLDGTSITVDYNGITFKAIHYGALAASPTYAATYVSQSWPLSSDAPVAMTVGQVKKGSLDMMNTGTATWHAGVVELAPIPRDQPSALRAPSWLSATRVSSVADDVPPGATGHFAWDLDPSQPGSFMPYFGLVAEGVTWFADSGGPPDDDLQVSLDVAPAPKTSGTGGASSTGSAGARKPASHGATGGCQMGQGSAPAVGALGAWVGLLLALRRKRRA